MNADDYIVLVATTIMVFACMVGIYLFRNGRKIEYGEDERLLSDDRRERSPRRSLSTRDDVGVKLENKKKKKKSERIGGNGTNAADSIERTKELKRKMKKKSS